MFLGEGRFSSPRTVEVDGQFLRFKRAVIATGGRATAPPIPGLAEVDYLTNETLFWLTALPARLLIIGGGPIGSEMAQAFSRFGSRVTIFETSPHLLAREDPDAAAIVQRRFGAEGIHLELGVTLTRVDTRDVCSRFKFTHAADAMARIVIQNALFHGRRKASALVIPWATCTDPGIAHVGLYEGEAREAGRAVETITVELKDVDRAVLDDDTEGFVRVHHEKGRLLGCTMVSAHAGEMIGEASYALTHGGKPGQFSATVHPYPTEAEAFRMAGDRYRRTALTPTTARWRSRYFRWTRGGSGS